MPSARTARAADDQSIVCAAVKWKKSKEVRRMSSTGRSMAMKKSNKPTRIHHNSRNVWALFGGARNQKAVRVEARDRKIVRNIVEPGETEEFIRRLREQFYSLADHALAAVRHALEITKDAELASLLLERPQATEKISPYSFTPSPEGRIVTEALKFHYEN
jgi:hypothetical protein